VDTARNGNAEAAGPVYTSLGNGAQYIGPLSIDSAGRVGFGNGNFFSWLRRRWNAESNRPMTKPNVRVTVEDLDAE